MLAGLAAVIAQLPSLEAPGEGSEGFQRMMTAFAILMGCGFLFGIAGHVVKVKALILAGIIMVFAATALFMIAVAQHG